MQPCHDVAHLGHVELLTDRFEESLDFFTRVYGLCESGREDGSVYLRAFDDYEFHTLKLTAHHTTGVGHVGYRVSSEDALVRRVDAIQAAGYGLGWVDGDLGHGRAYRFRDAFGHVFEVYWETRKYEAEGPERPALKNLAQRYHGRGCCPRRIDHVNLLADDVAEFRDFMLACLGSRVTEQIRLDDGRLAGCWFTVNNKDVRSRLHGGARRRGGTAAPRDLRDGPARGHPEGRRHLPGERGPHRDRAAQARDPGDVLSLRVGTGRQPGRTRELRRPPHPPAGLGTRDLDRGGQKEGPGLGTSGPSRASTRTGRLRSSAEPRAPSTGPETFADRSRGAFPVRDTTAGPGGSRDESRCGFK